MMNVHKVVSLVMVLLFTLVVGVNFATAVPASVKAKSEYLLADKLFNSGDFSGAIEHAQKALAILGKTNSRIQYLLTKAYVATDQPDLAFVAIERFFEVTPESMSGSGPYNEMVEQYSMIEESVRKLREVEEEEKIAQEVEQDIQYCSAVCWANAIPLFRQKARSCFAEAEKKNKSLNKAVSGEAKEEFEIQEAEEVQTEDLATVTSKIADLAKPCTDNAWNVLKPTYSSCVSHCQDQEFRQEKLQKMTSTPLRLLIIGESKILGFRFNYQQFTAEIWTVMADTPIEVAGLAVDDVIVAVDGKPIKYKNYINDVRDKIISGEIESAVLDVRRDGHKMEYLLRK